MKNGKRKMENETYKAGLEASEVTCPPAEAFNPALVFSLSAICYPPDSLLGLRLKEFYND